MYKLVIESNRKVGRGYTTSGSGNVNVKLRAFIAGVVGMAVGFGVSELVHGFYEPVPSLPVAVSQRLIVLMPASITEVGIALLGEADIPVLVTTTVVLTLVFAGLLARLALRSVVGALIGVVVLGVVGITASLFEPVVRLVAAVLTVVGALGIGAGVSGLIMYASGLRSPEA